MANLARDNLSSGGTSPRGYGPAAIAPTPRSARADHLGALTQAHRLNIRAPQMNAAGAERIPHGKEPWCRLMDLWGAAAVLIHVWIEGSQPLLGQRQSRRGDPLRFDGWLELLRVVSELVAADTVSRTDSGTAERADEEEVRCGSKLAATRKDNDANWLDRHFGWRPFGPHRRRFGVGPSADHLRSSRRSAPD